MGVGQGGNCEGAALYYRSGPMSIQIRHAASTSCKVFLLASKESQPPRQVKFNFSVFVPLWGFARKVAYTLFSVQPLCALCLCGSLLLRKNNHRDTEHTEVAQRRSRIETFRAKPVNHVLKPGVHDRMKAN